MSRSSVSADYDDDYSAMKIQELNDEFYKIQRMVKLGDSFSLYKDATNLRILKPRSFSDISTQLVHISKPRTSASGVFYAPFFIHDGMSWARGVAFDRAAKKLYKKLAGSECHFVDLENLHLAHPDPRYHNTPVPYEVRFHEFSSVEVRDVNVFADFETIKSGTFIPRIRCILARKIRPQPSHSDTFYVGAVIDVDEEAKIEIFCDFKPEAEHKQGAVLILKGAKLTRKDDVVRLHVYNAWQIKELTDQEHVFDESWNVNNIPFRSQGSGV